MGGLKKQKMTKKQRTRKAKKKHPEREILGLNCADSHVVIFENAAVMPQNQIDTKTILNQKREGIYVIDQSPYKIILIGN